MVIRPDRPVCRRDRHPDASNRSNIQIGPLPESRQRPDLHLAQG